MRDKISSTESLGHETTFGIKKQFFRLTNEKKKKNVNAYKCIGSNDNRFSRRGI